MQNESESCIKCKKKMRSSFSSISGNAKYMNYVCEACGHKETKCTGLMK